MSILHSPGFERRTGELRIKQAKVGRIDKIDVVVGIMEKWMVQDGEAFCGYAPPIGGLYQCITPNQPHWWMGDIWMPTFVKLKEEWRELSVYTAVQGAAS